MSTEENSIHSNIPTPHISAAYGDFAETVLMPGDPLRAKYIAEHFLEDAKCVTDVRNMLGFTGTYRGRRVSVMGSGMGMPSIGIYSHELFAFYGAEQIIRIGSAGSISEKLRVKDILIAEGASTTSAWQSKYHLNGTFAPSRVPVQVSNSRLSAISSAPSRYCAIFLQRLGSPGRITYSPTSQGAV